MNNKVDFASAENAAEKINLRLTPEKYRGFPDVCDFCAACVGEGDGELRLKDDVAEWISVEDIVRDCTPDDASCFDSVKCKIASGGDR